MKLTLTLWAFLAGVLNKHIDGTTAAVREPVGFRRGPDAMALVRCDPAKVGLVTYQTPNGENRTEELAEAEVGQIIKAFGYTTDTNFELPPLLGYGDEQRAQAAGAGADYDQSRVRP
jgi:hypothetical protein